MMGFGVVIGGSCDQGSDESVEQGFDRRQDQDLQLGVHVTHPDWAIWPMLTTFGGQNFPARKWSWASRTP